MTETDLAFGTSAARTLTVVGLLLVVSAFLGIGSLPQSHETLSGGSPVAAHIGPQAPDARRTPSANSSASDCQSAGGPVYANGTGKVFLICAATGNVAVISTSNDTVIASIPIGPGLLGASAVSK